MISTTKEKADTQSVSLFNELNNLLANHIRIAKLDERIECIRILQSLNMVDAEKALREQIEIDQQAYMNQFKQKLNDIAS